MKSFPILSVLLLALIFMGCSDDDDFALSASSGGATYDTVNTCGNTAPYLTRFDFAIELESPPTEDLGGVEFDIEWSDGDIVEDRFEDDLIITGSVVEFDWCFRFGSTEWIELHCTILDEDDNVLSNEVTIRADKPDGAN